MDHAPATSPVIGIIIWGVDLHLIFLGILKAPTLLCRVHRGWYLISCHRLGFLHHCFILCHLLYLCTFISHSGARYSPIYCSLVLCSSNGGGIFTPSIWVSGSVHYLGISGGSMSMLLTSGWESASVVLGDMVTSIMELHQADVCAAISCKGHSLHLCF